jgi:hypothetical protein
MVNAPTKAAVSVTPPLVPSNFVEMLQEADDVIALMAREPLDVVAELANALSVSAQGTGAWEIAETAGAVQRIASEHRSATLTGPMRDLTAAVARARREYHLEP